MGRGRAKAKQTKVARELKYRSFDMDLDSLEAELRSPDDQQRVPDAYADFAEEDDGHSSQDHNGDYSSAEQDDDGNSSPEQRR